MPVIYSLYIINKSGGLIFYKVEIENFIQSKQICYDLLPFCTDFNVLGKQNMFQDYGSAGRMDTNDSLRLASLWHSMHAISQQLSPVTGCLGIELLEADTFDLHCFQSLTGTFIASFSN